MIKTPHGRKSYFLLNPYILVLITFFLKASSLFTNLKPPALSLSMEINNDATLSTKPTVLSY